MPLWPVSFFFFGLIKLRQLSPFYFFASALFFASAFFRHINFLPLCFFATDTQIICLKFYCDSQQLTSHCLLLPNLLIPCNLLNASDFISHQLSSHCLLLLNLLVPHNFSSLYTEFQKDLIMNDNLVFLTDNEVITIINQIKKRN